LAHLGNLREKITEEIRSLKAVYKTICDHNNYLRSQLDSYKAYLQNVRQQTTTDLTSTSVVKVGDKEKKPEPIRTEKPTKSRNDKNVVSHKAPETTKMSFAYKEENEKKENEINVNEILKTSEEKKRYGMRGVGDILKRFDTVPPASLVANQQISKKTRGENKA